MSEVVKHLEQAGVLIEVNASLERFTTGDEATSLKDRLSRYMQDLMTDLSLPVSLFIRGTARWRYGAIQFVFVPGTHTG